MGHRVACQRAWFERPRSTGRVRGLGRRAWGFEGGCEGWASVEVSVKVTLRVVGASGMWVGGLLCSKTCLLSISGGGSR